MHRAARHVSIRAPMQGATTGSGLAGASNSVSIRAPMQGATRRAGGRERRSWFRSAPPCRGRPPAHQVRAAPGRFDPRPHAGGDGLYINTGAPDGQFRSAPLCRGRPRQAASACKSTVSIRAPMQGATSSAKRRPSVTRSFDPRPHAGGDRLLPIDRASRWSFDPRPHAGGDPPMMASAAIHTRFRSAPPCRGDPPTEVTGERP